MKILIFGAGAIGLFTAGHCARLGHQTKLITRTPDQSEQIRQFGVSVESQTGAFTQKIEAESAMALSESITNDVDLMINAVKQTSISEWLEQVEPYIDGKTKERVPILFLQNGMGHVEQAIRHGFVRSYPAIVTHGVLKHTSTKVEHTGRGALIVNSELGSLLINGLNDEPDFPVNQTDDVIGYQKKKLIVNAVVNPVTAIYGIRNGKMIENEHVLSVGRSVFEEALPVLGLRMEDWDFVLDVIRKTSRNQSSMKVDMDKGRRTEVDAILGFIIEEAQKRGLEVPVTENLLNKVHQMEKERGVR